jgi:hypothetical protein
MKKLIFLILGFSIKTFATTAIVSTQLAGQSKQWSAGVQHSVESVPEDFSLGLSFDFARSTQVSNYNTSVNDFTIEKNAISAGLDLGWDQTLKISFEATSAGINSREATVLGLKTKLGVVVPDLTLTVGLADQYLRQLADFKILGSSVQDQLTLKMQKQFFAVGYSGFEDVSISLSYDKYTYDRDIQSLNTILSVKNVLIQNGASFLSQINSLLDHEVSLDLTYALNEDIDLDFTVSESVDYLDPYTKSRGYRAGFTYYFSDFDLSAGASNIRTLDTGDSSFSVDATVAYSF